MKALQYLIIAAFIVSCAPKGEQALDPGDVDGRRTLLAEKKKDLQELKKEIAKLSKEIYLLDPPKEKKAVQVKTEILKKTNFKRFIEVQATVVAEDKVNVSSEVGGRLTALNVKEGDYVKRGQLIAKTDMVTVENQIAELQTSLNLAQTVFERQERLWKQNIGSELQYLEAESNKERLENSLATIKSQISKKNIYAPISGTVEMKYMNQGETVSPGMPIIQILNTSKTKVVADIQESFLGKIKRGDEVEINFPALNETTKSKVTMLGRSIDPANRTFKVEFSGGGLGSRIKPNLMASVRFNDLEQNDAVVIPLDVIQEDVGGNKFVFRAKTQDNKKFAEKVLIELGESSKEGVVILIGLQPGDELINAGGLNLSDKDPIIVIDSE